MAYHGKAYHGGASEIAQQAKEKQHGKGEERRGRAEETGDEKGGMREGGDNKIRRNALSIIAAHGAAIMA